MAGVAEVTDQNFDAEVLQAEVPAIVDFWAEWCAPCKQVAPQIADYAGKYASKVKIVKMNVDENVETPGRYHIRSIPTFIAFRGGQVVEQIVGIGNFKARFEEMLKKLTS
jgi:thioredoxin 1